jgi:hypothetical protein
MSVPDQLSLRMAAYRRTRIAPYAFAALDIECVMNAFQRPVPFPHHKVVVCRALRRQDFGQRLPLAAGRVYVEDRVQDDRREVNVITNTSRVPTRLGLFAVIELTPCFTSVSTSSKLSNVLISVSLPMGIMLRFR